MMGMAQRLGVVQEQSCPMCESCLPLSEAFILESPQHFQALRSWAVDEAEYRSLMDYLLVSVFPHEKPGCLAHYAGRGPRLIELRTATYIKRLDILMHRFLRESYRIFSDERAARWLLESSCTVCPDAGGAA